jgi:hypothetical protein
MANHQISHRITPWAGRYCAQVLVDKHYEDAHKLFDTYEEAEQWAIQRKAEKRSELKGDCYQ